ncbi:MAG: sensor domain-containing diguanylate cyclase [Candidatus Omnitrophica bacterium]|nr:sensor domain-containing diguanylate cyclase [Candidatus Omnitrophota bacterium]
MKRQAKNIITNYPIVALTLILSVSSVFCAVKAGLAVVAALVVFLAGLLFFIDKRQKGKLVTSQKLYDGLLSANEVAQSFALATESEDTLEIILLGLKEILPASKRILLFWVKQEGGKKRIEGRAAFGMELSEIRGFSFPLHEAFGVIPKVAVTQQSFETLNARNDYRCDREFVERARLSAFLAIPVTVAQNTLGVILLETSGKNFHGAGEIETLSFFANQVGIALENVRLYREVETLSVTDGLTGLYNHRHFQKILLEELSRSVRYKHPLSLLMVDVDYFKDYNDTYGHPAGDALLVAAAQIIRRNIRNTDAAARYGGDEFCVVLTETDKEAAFMKAGKICREMEACRLPDNQKQPGKNPSFSIGVAAFPADAGDREKLLKKVDEALYRSKKEGRNRASRA